MLALEKPREFLVFIGNSAVSDRCKSIGAQFHGSSCIMFDSKGLLLDLCFMFDSTTLL